MSSASELRATGQKRQCLCYTPLLEGSTECDSEPWLSQEGLWGGGQFGQNFFGKSVNGGEVMAGVGRRRRQESSSGQ